MSSSPRIFNDGRLELAGGVRLDRDARWLSREEASLLVESGARVIHSRFPRSTDITTDTRTIAALIDRVSPEARDVGAQRYHRSGVEAIVFFESC